MVSFLFLSIILNISLFRKNFFDYGFDAAFCFWLMLHMIE